MTHRNIAWLLSILFFILVLLLKGNGQIIALLFEYFFLWFAMFVCDKLEQTKELIELLRFTSIGYSKLLQSWKKDAKWYLFHLKAIMLAANDPDGTLEEIHKLVDDAIKHEERENGKKKYDTTTK
jgi:hypothetical protein